MKRFLGIFILSVILLFLFFCILLFKNVKSKYQRENCKQQYKNKFQQEPDLLTLDKLQRNYSKGKPYFLQEFSHDILSSKNECQNKTIIFIGLIRNNGKKALAFWTPILNYIGSYFQDFRVIFVENDSEDNTRSELVDYAKSHPHYFVFCPKNDEWNADTCNLGFVSAKEPTEKENNLKYRLDVLAHLRESYVPFLKENDNTDYVVMVDWDLQGDLSLQGFFHALSVLNKTPNIDGVAVNSFCQHNKKWYIFDTFPLFPNFHCREINRRKKELERRVQNKYRRLLTEAIYPIPVDSAFGGLAIYKGQCFGKKNPHFTGNDCPYQCEHSFFQKNLNMIIDPWFIFLIYKNMH